MIDIHTHKDVSSGKTVAIRNLFPGQAGLLSESGVFSIGLHPWYINEGSLEDDFEIISGLASKPNVIAIGETGLDKHKGKDFDIQMKVFKMHCHLAGQVKKPVIIHCVRSFNEVIALKKNLHPSTPWIIHGFNAGGGIAASLIRHLFYLSFGKGILNPHSPACAVLKNIPDESFFLETDDSGADISEIYQKAASIRRCHIDDLTGCIENNFRKIFSYP